MRWQVVRNGHGKLWVKGTHSMDISELCHPWNRGRALSHSLSPSTRRRKMLAWSYGENDSSPWTPVCTLTSVLTNTFQLVQRIPGQPGRHSTGCVHRLADQEWTCKNGAIQTKLLVCPMMNTACSTQDQTTANGIAIGCARHWEGTIWLKCDWWKNKNYDDC